ARRSRRCLEPSARSSSSWSGWGTAPRKPGGSSVSTPVPSAPVSIGLGPPCENDLEDSMSDLRDLLDRSFPPIDVRDRALERTLDRAARRTRRKRIGAAVLAFVVAAAGASSAAVFL